MSFSSRARSWMRTALRRSSVEQSQQSEWHFHIDARAADLEHAGLTREEAFRVARAEFGSLEARRDESREAVGLRAFDELRADFRYAVRLLRVSPSFTTVAVLSLALGIGANSAIFSLMESVLWKTLPVQAPEQLRQLTWVSGPEPVMSSTWGNLRPTETGGRMGGSFSYPAFQAMQRHAERSLQLVAFKPIGRLTALIDDSAELVEADLVSGNFYQDLGIRTITGRGILPADDQRAAAAVAVISEAFWTRRFGRHASAIGRTIRVNQLPVTIVGVNPPAFTGLTPGRLPDLFVPVSQQPVIFPFRWGKSPSLLDDPDYWWVLVMGRLAAGVDERHLQSGLDLALGDVVRPLLDTRPGSDRPHVRLTAGDRGVNDLRDEFSQPLLVLVAFVGLVLIIACANLANLLLARASARQREISLRLALGAGAPRIARQMLTEGLVLALLGGLAGVLVGFWLRDAIPHLLSTSWNPSPVRPDFSGRVMLLSFAVTLLTGVLFSLAPMWHAARAPVSSSLKEGARSTAGRSRRLTRRSLVVVQVGLSIVLLIAGGLFVRTLWNLRTADLGFDARQIVLFTIDPPRTRYVSTARSLLFTRLEAEIAGLPGVQSASLSSDPLVAGSRSTTHVIPTGRASRGVLDRAWVNDVGTMFFETMGIPIVNGRGLGPQDRAGSLRVAVINQQLARSFFPGVNPVGQTFVNGKDVYQIVGVSGDARFDRITTPMPPTFYRPFTQAPDLSSMTFEVRTPLEPGALVQSVRAAVARVDKDLPVFDVRSQLQQIDATLSQPRLFAALTSAFGLLALMLASVGIYGVIAGSVASRTVEIGVRMALGANRRQVLSMILRETFSLAGLGVLVGVLTSAVVGRYLSTYLYNVTPSDPLATAAAVLSMLAVALLSGWWPARAAASLDPMRALRHD